MRKWFKKAKKKVKKGVKKFGKWAKKTGKKIGRGIMRFNPLTIAVRTAFRGLVAINFLGLASMMHIGAMSTWAEAKKAGVTQSVWRKCQTAWEKTKKLYRKGGGSVSKLSKTAKSGKNRKALFNKKAEKALHGLGEPLTLAAGVTAALPLLTPIAKYFGGLDKLKKTTDKVKGSEIFKAGKKAYKNLTKQQKASAGGANTPEEVDFVEDNSFDSDSGVKPKKGGAMWWVAIPVGVTLLSMVFRNSGSKK